MKFSNLLMLLGIIIANVSYTQPSLATFDEAVVCGKYLDHIKKHELVLDRYINVENGQPLGNSRIQQVFINGPKLQELYSKLNKILEPITGRTSGFFDFELGLLLHKEFGRWTYMSDNSAPQNSMILYQYMPRLRDYLTGATYAGMQCDQGIVQVVERYEEGKLNIDVILYKRLTTI